MTNDHLRTNSWPNNHSNVWDVFSGKIDQWPLQSGLKPGKPGDTIYVSGLSLSQNREEFRPSLGQIEKK